jgi:hypothetical protein
METAMTYFGAMALFGLSAVLIKGTSPFSDASCAEYIGRQKRRRIGQLILFIASIIMAIAVLDQIISSAP